MRTGSATYVMLVAVVLGCTIIPANAAEAVKEPGRRELRTAMNQAEKRFLELYNRLNDDGRHDVACANEERAGSRLRRSRTCRSAGESAINEDAARAYLRDLDMAASVDTDTATGRASASAARDSAPPPDRIVNTGTLGDDTGATIVNAGTKLQEERAAFNAHLQGLLQQHPELRERFTQYMRARSRYEAADGR